MKIIFLDIDGVLNCRWCKNFIDGYHFVMDEKILLLKQLVDRTGAKIVLSSTWRFGWIYMDAYTSENDVFQQREIRHFIALREKLQEFGLEIFSRTPVSELNFRGLEIDQWLQEWEEERIESFVILDDMNGRYLRPHSNCLVQTSLQTGLMQKHVEKAVKILEKTCC